MNSCAGVSLNFRSFICKHSHTYVCMYYVCMFIYVCVRACVLACMCFIHFNIYCMFVGFCVYVLINALAQEIK